MILAAHCLQSIALAKVNYEKTFQSIHFTNFISSAMEFPAIIIMIFFLLRAGRRITLLTLYVICGVALLGTWAIPK